MASLQRDLADDPESALSAAAVDGASVKLNRRSVGGYAFEIQFEPDGAAAVDTAAGAAGLEVAASGDAAAAVPERLLQQRQAAEQRAELDLKTVEETLKAAEERRLETIEKMKQRIRGQSAGAKERCEALRKQQEDAKLQLEADLQRDILEKEARRKEQLDKIVQGAQQHLAKVEEVRAQRQNPSDAAPADN